MLGVVTVVAGLSTGNKIGLAVVGGAFIVFALLSSFVLPKRYPNFPGRHVGWFVVAGVCFLLAMLTAVLVFGVEEPASESAGTTAAQTTTAETTTAQTSDRADDDRGDDHRNVDRGQRRRRGRRRRPGRRGRGEGGLRERRLRRLPHTGGGQGERERRPEPRSAQAVLRPGRAPGRDRRRRDAVLQGRAERQADRGRVRIRQLVRLRLNGPRNDESRSGEERESPQFTSVTGFRGSR